MMSPYWLGVPWSDVRSPVSKCCVLSWISFLLSYTSLAQGSQEAHTHTDTPSPLSVLTMLFSMFHPLGVTAILSVIGVSFAMVVNRDAALDRKRIKDKCSGYDSGFLSWNFINVFLELHRRCIWMQVKKSSFKTLDMNLESSLRGARWVRHWSNFGKVHL